MPDCDILGVFVRDEILKMKRNKYPNVIIVSAVEDYYSGEAPCCQDCEKRKQCYPDEY